MKIAIHVDQKMLKNIFEVTLIVIVGYLLLEKKTSAIADVFFLKIKKLYFFHLIFHHCNLLFQHSLLV